MTTGSVAQARALFGLRWQMIRSDGVKIAVVLTGIGMLWLLQAIAHGVAGLDAVRVATAVEVAPETFLGFGVLALIAPLTAGGGNEVVPSSQLVAYPVRPRTVFLGGLVLAPVNLVWVLQILALVAETALLSLEGQAALPAVTTMAFVCALTAAGQAVAWLVVGLRQSRRGRQVVGATGLALLTAAVVVVRTGSGRTVLDHSPTGQVVRAVTAGARGELGAWLPTTAVLVAMTALGLVLGERACAWALRRPGDSGSQRSARAVRRRPSSHGPLRALVAMDRASVWRAPALRRGGLVLAVLPALGAAGAQVPWQSMVVLPGLIAAGAGLLFGVNAFCLDGSGALFLASLPHDPRLLVRAKLIVLTETVLAAVVIAAVAGSLRSPGTPTAAEVVGILVGGLACTAVVVSRSLASSVRHPHRADLAGPRDAVAPPGALALASARLALPSALVGFVLQQSTRYDRWWLPVLVSLPVFALAGASLARSLSLWSRPVVRARIVQVVSAG